MKRNLLLLGLLIFGAAGALALANHSGTLHTSPAALLALRWFAITSLVGYALARRSLTAWIILGMIIGAEIGHDWPVTGVHLQILGQIFLRLIKVIIAPLLFSTLVVGIAGHADLKKVGRMGIKALVYFEVVSTIALFLGLAAINVSRAGVGIRLPPSASAAPLTAAPQSASDLILNVFPENIAKSVAEGQVLQVVVFSVIFALGLALVKESKRQPMLAFAESLAETMFKVTNIVMLFAPLGVAGAIAYAVGHMGFGILVPLAKLLTTMYVALAMFLLLVLLPIALLARVPLAQFLRAIAEPASIAFGTSSSEAALPRAMEVMEAIGVPRPIVAFVMPTGYSFNLDGSSLYQSLALIFVAQAAGVHLSPGQQLVMMLTLLLSSKGTAGVARASLVIVLAAAASFRLPLEPIFLLFGIDQLMDMGRTTVNVIGNCLATVVIARWEGDFPKTRALSAVDDPLVE